MCWYTFCFDGYCDPHRVNFGALRAFNDCLVEGGGATVPHHLHNVEQILIPLEGVLLYSDDTGGMAELRPGQAHLLSAGAGVVWREVAGSASVPAKFLRLWIYPGKSDVPSVSRRAEVPESTGVWRTVASPYGAEGGLPVGQDARICLATLAAGTSASYAPHAAGRGVYIFVVEGDVSVADVWLHRRDGIGLEDAGEIVVGAATDSRLLLIEVPMRDWYDEAESW